AELEVPLGGDRVRAALWEHPGGPGRVLFLDPPGFFDRPHLYGPPTGDYPDNPYRFAFLARGAVEAAVALDLRPDAFHAHDWQAGVLPVYLRRQMAGTAVGRAGTVFTVHNMGYQGLFPAEIVSILD